MSIVMRAPGRLLEPRSFLRRVRQFSARVLLGGLLLVMLGLASPIEAAGSMRGELTGLVENGHGRLVFTFGGDVKSDVQISNGILIVSFSEPVTLTTESLEKRMPGYVQAVRRDPDGTGVRLSLGRRVTVNVMEAGERLFVDLLPDTWKGLPPGLPQSVVDDLARRAREAERVARIQPAAPAVDPLLSVVRLQVMNAPTFARFAFDLPVPVPVEFERDGQELQIHFTSPVRIDLGTARAQLPKGVVGLDVAFESNRSTVKLVLAPSAEAREFREERAVLVDVTPGPLGATPAMIRDIAEQSAPRSEAAPENSVEAADPVREQASVVGEPIVTPRNEARGGDDLPPAALDLDRYAGGQVLVPVVGRQGGHFSIDFNFGTPVPAAAFVRGDNIWLVFDTERDIDLSGLTSEPTRTILEVRSLRTENGIAVRLRPTLARLASIEQDDLTWRLVLADHVVSPSRPLPLRRVADREDRGIVTVPLAGAGLVHRIEDPDVGDSLIVVTAHPPASGMLREQRFLEFRVLASVHGLAFAPVADDVVVTVSPEGATIRRPDGLAISNKSPALLVPAAAQATPGESLLNVDSWVADQAAPFAEREAELIRAVTTTPAAQRTEARLLLARFYLAQGFAAEAIGVLEIGAREDKQFFNEPLYAFLRGLAELEIGRPDDALPFFRSAKIVDAPEAKLMQGVALADLGRWTAARDVIRKGLGAVDGLPIDLQKRTLFAAARTAIEVRDLSDGTRFMQELELIGVPPERKAEFSLLAGRIAENIGRFDRARQLYETVADLQDGPAAAEASFRSIAMRFARGEIYRATAIDRLETLALLWRGDRIELDTIRLLGRLHVAESNYRAAFRLLDAALQVDDESETTHEFHGEMAAVFEDLFLTGKADALPAIEALALYYDFSRLTPIGRRGDELIRRLADRLVSVDLLDQAAELLDHQVNYRLTGAAKAQVAAKLAIVYLKNRKPADAVRTLAATRMPQLPQEVREQRMLVEARALSDTGRHDTALELLEHQHSPEADRLRADVLWAAQRWRDAGERLEALVGERWKDEAPLDASDRHDVLRAAVAYVLGGESISLARVKEKFAEKMGDTTEGKVLQLVASEKGATPTVLTEAARALASFDSLAAFIQRYRERYPDIPLSADPTPTSSLFRAQRLSVR